MIITRSPMRVSLGGGGTDLPSYYREFGGFLVAAAIDKYVFVCAHRRFDDQIRLAYSKTEQVDSVDKIEHRIYRESLRFTGLGPGIELHSMADMPANSGLGSSSSFTVAALNAMHAFKREFVPTKQLAEEACKIEIDILKEPIGKQDQYISAYGGVTAFTFHSDGSVDAERVAMREEAMMDLEANLLIFYSGIERSASQVLSEQKKTITENKDDAVNRMHRIKLLHEHWTNKRKLASNMTSSVIDEHYEAARKAGAVGGKLMGAGGGGFFMFYVRPGDKRRVYEALANRGLRHTRFRFDYDGARILANFHRS